MCLYARIHIPLVLCLDLNPQMPMLPSGRTLFMFPWIGIRVSGLLPFVFQVLIYNRLSSAVNRGREADTAVEGCSPMASCFPKNCSDAGLQSFPSSDCFDPGS